MPEAYKYRWVSKELFDETLDDLKDSGSDDGRELLANLLIPILLQSRDAGTLCAEILAEAVPPTLKALNILQAGIVIGIKLVERRTKIN